MDIRKEIHDDFIIFAEEANNERAFPSAKDGLKPGQRATLWEMFNKNYNSSKPHVKCAKITGGVIGNWWPHGDIGVYEGLVGMSQNWVRNIPEIDFHGANGSVQGGPDAASSRYTEARLSKASEDGFFDIIKKNTVDFIPNFSEDEYWPKVFPAIFPRLFVNGSKGIGYTIANDWQPGNLNEFTEKVKEYIKDKKITFTNIYPDFPTGGIIINEKDVEEIYKTGKGSVILRAKTEIKDKTITITELPYQVYVEDIITKIQDLINNDNISGIDDIFNKSDKNSGIKVEIVCSKDTDPNIVLNQLFRQTDLQKSYSVNQMAIVDRVPELLNLEDYIKVYVNHNLDCIKREYQFDLDKAIARKEVVEGLLKALVNIDDIILCIKKSKDQEDAKKNLQKKFGFTENQANAIVSMRLGRLAHLESVELEKENKELEKTIEDCNSVLASVKKQEKILVNRLEDFTKTYGWERRTKLDNIDIVVERKEVNKDKPKVKKEFMVILTANNSLKRTQATTYKHITKGVERELMSVKVATGGKVKLISNKGNHYKLPINKLNVGLPNATGTNLNTLLDLDSDEIIIGVFNKENSTLPYILFMTEKGEGKKVKSEVILKIGKATKTPVIKLKEDDKLIYVSQIKENATVNVKTNKRDIQIITKELKEKGRGAGGSKIVKLRKEETIETIN